MKHRATTHATTAGAATAPLSSAYYLRPAEGVTATDQTQMHKMAITILSNTIAHNRNQIIAACECVLAWDADPTAQQHAAALLRYERALP